ncbi:MAG: hypothetical protein EOP87_15785, partial [Verrucomicrobiaceae bacterium]
MSFRMLLPVITLLVAALPATAEKFRFERPLMGTRFMVVCHGDDRDRATKAADVAFRAAEEVNATASDYLP